MTRPLYETDADLTREKAVIEKVKAAWGCCAVKRPMVRGHNAPLDYTLTWGRKERVVEVKTRTCPSTKHDTYQISTKKVRKALKHRNSILVVQFTDTIKWCYFNEPHDEREGGRYDRGDPCDIEMMAIYQMAAFHSLDEFP